MATPSRVYVSVVVFGLLLTALLVPFTILVIVGYQPPPTAPYQNLFPDNTSADPGVKLFLILACLFCIALTVTGGRALLKAARRSAASVRGEVAPPGPPSPPPREQPTSPSETGIERDRRSKSPDAPPPGYQ